MLVHDQYSGYIHEVPDQLYGLGEVYDGLGHPLGLPFLSALAPLASRLLPALAPIVSRIPGVGNLVGGALQNVGNLTQGAGNVIGQAAQLPFNVAGQGISATGQALANLSGHARFPRRRSRPRRSCRAACLDPGRWVGSVHRCLTPGSGRDGSTCVARYGRDRRASCLAMRRTCRPAHSRGFRASPSRRSCRMPGAWL